jgi:hypothetical protein
LRERVARIVDARRVRGSGLSPCVDPSSGTDFVRATFSRRGRRERKALVLPM